jgi:hypothetical protein
MEDPPIRQYTSWSMSRVIRYREETSDETADSHTGRRSPRLRRRQRKAGSPYATWPQLIDRTRRMADRLSIPVAASPASPQRCSWRPDRVFGIVALRAQGTVGERAARELAVHLDAARQHHRTTAWNNLIISLLVIAATLAPSVARPAASRNDRSSHDVGADRHRG